VNLVGTMLNLTMVSALANWDMGVIQKVNVNNVVIIAQIAL
jgi:hypothetical protein